MKYSLTALLLVFVPGIALAGDTIITLVDRGTGFLGNVVIDFLLAVALLAFVINAARYFIIGGSNEKDREKAKSLTIYSIMAFVLIIVLWGIINMLVNGLDFNRKAPLKTDFGPGYDTGPSIDP